VDAGSSPGGIFWLLELIEEHTAAVARDFREKFGLSVFELGTRTRWDEAHALARGLFKDPSSWLFAELSGWQMPMHPLEPALADLYDLTNQKFVKQRVKQYPRRWANKNRLGGKSKVQRTSAEVRRLLRG
jgi:hypothetical protein